MKTKVKILAAFDCETTGGELFHGDLPFMICITFENKEQVTIEWDVDPWTRTPLINIDELAYLVSILMDDKYQWIGHNIKFDTRCVEKAIAHVLGSYSDEELLQSEEIKILKSFDPVTFLQYAHDTHTLSHAIDNRGSHGLKDLCVRYLDIGEDDVYALKEEVESARAFGKQQGWAIASPSTRPLSSSQEESNVWWKIDMWVPHAEYLATEHIHQSSSPFVNRCQTYCLRDTERTLLLFVLLRDLVTNEGLWNQYLMNQRLLAVTYEQEQYGASINLDTLRSEQNRFIALEKQFTKRANDALGMDTFNLSSTEQVALLLKNIFNVPIERETKAGKSTINKDELETIYSKYSEALAHSSQRDKVFIIEERNGKKQPVYKDKQDVERLLEFVMCCMARKKCIKAANQDLAGYAKRAITYQNEDGSKETYLHSSVNLVATDTTRIGAHDPNLTNVSKGKNAFNEDIKELDLSLRKIFGPVAGRKWVAFDYSQLQLVIAATISGEQNVIDAIERGDDLHEFMHGILADRLGWQFDRDDDGQRTIAKNTNFGFWFGAGDDKINRTTHTTGIYRVLCDTFPNAHSQIRKDIRDAERHGWVSASGYRLYPPPEKPYAATVYKVQGWEGKIAKRAAYDCWCSLNQESPDTKLILFVHDELVFDMPIDEPLSTYSLIKHLMISAGLCEGIKVNVGVKEILHTWQDGKKVDV